MYNVRFIEYPDSIQVRLYERVVGDDFGLSTIDCPADLPYKEEFIPGIFYTAPKDFDFDDLESDDNRKSRKKAESLRSSLSRTKTNLYYIARSNVWQYFLTLTISPNKVKSRYDYVECSKKVRKFFNHIKERKYPNMYYLLVPEQHKDGAWHFHGLVGGAPDLAVSDSGLKTKDGLVIYTWDDYKIGFTTLTAVKDSGKASSYITKYISKSLIELTKGHQRYYVSKNVQKAKVTDVLVKDVKQIIRQLSEKADYVKTVDGYNQTIYMEIPKKGE